jgi:hypothetical protein
MHSSTQKVENPSPHKKEKMMRRWVGECKEASFFSFFQKSLTIFIHDQLFTDKPINCNLPSLINSVSNFSC